MKIDEDWKIIKKSFYQGGGSIIFPYCQLIFGVLWYSYPLKKRFDFIYMVCSCVFMDGITEYCKIHVFKLYFSIH
jgi:hypothetical protein